MKTSKIKEIRLIIMHTKKFIEQSEKDESANINELANKFAYQYGYLSNSIETIYKILKRDISIQKKNNL